MRTDIHRPAAIIPADYEFVGQEAIKIDGIEACEVITQERARIAAHMARTGGTYSGHEHGGNCMVCGSVNAIYTALFYHAATNSYVRMGQDCALKCEMGNEGDFNAFRAGIIDARARKAGKDKARLLLADRGLSRAWDITEHVYDDNKYFERGREERIIADIVEKLVKYGSASDAQFNLVAKLLGDIDTRAEREAKRAAETAAAKPVPSGRFEVEGEVLTTKFQSSQFGDVLKMLVKHADGWKVWGTVPGGLDIQRGDRVKFTATVEASKDDPKFGFFKRPTKAEKLA